MIDRKIKVFDIQTKQDGYDELFKNVEKWKCENNVIVEKYQAVSSHENNTWHAVYVTYIENPKRKLMTEKSDD